MPHLRLYTITFGLIYLRAGAKTLDMNFHNFLNRCVLEVQCQYWGIYISGYVLLLEIWRHKSVVSWIWTEKLTVKQQLLLLSSWNSFQGLWFIWRPPEGLILKKEQIQQWTLGVTVSQGTTEQWSPESHITTGSMNMREHFSAHAEWKWL